MSYLNYVIQGIDGVSDVVVKGLSSLKELDKVGKS
jgi:hypothetical protein